MVRFFMTPCQILPSLFVMLSFLVYKKLITKRNDNYSYKVYILLCMFEGLLYFFVFFCPYNIQYEKTWRFRLFLIIYCAAVLYRTFLHHVPYMSKKKDPILSKHHNCSNTRLKNYKVILKEPRFLRMDLYYHTK